MLVGATLPRNQTVADAHSPAGIKALGLPAAFPSDGRGGRVGHGPCQVLGAAIQALSLRGVRARSAQSRDGSGRELAWFPATARSRAQPVARLDFDAWYWG